MWPRSWSSFHFSHFCSTPVWTMWPRSWSSFPLSHFSTTPWLCDLNLDILFPFSTTPVSTVWRGSSSFSFFFSHLFCNLHRLSFYRIGGVMVSVLTPSAVDRGFEPRSGHKKDHQIGICYFSAKHAALRRKSKDWSARNQNNVSEWSDMSTRGRLFQWASTIKKIQLGVLV